MHTYISYIINTTNELHDGSAILIKQSIKHKINDRYDTYIFQITIDTNTGLVNIGTTYLPPRRQYLPFRDFHKIASQSQPSYIIGDINSHHPNLDNKPANNVGKAIVMMSGIN